jgi:hypothetical protein
LSQGVQVPASPVLASIAAHPPDPLQDSADLGHEIERVQADMERGIQLAGIKNDPVLPLIRVLSSSLALQWRLHDQAVRYFRNASDRLDQQLADTIAQGEQALATRRIAIVESLAPELAKLTAKSVRTWNRSVTLKTALTFGGFAVALALGVGLAGYGAGWQAGHTSALGTAGALAGAIHQAGPDAETALVGMVRANNVADAWSRCQQTATADKEGRRVCSMPMWADPQGQPKGWGLAGE